MNQDTINKDGRNGNQVRIHSSPSISLRDLHYKKDASDIRKGAQCILHTRMPEEKRSR